MTVRIEIARLVAGVIVMLAGFFLLSGCVSVAMGIEIAWLVAGVIVMLAWLFLGHICPPKGWF